jgi:L-ascorbate metabolism protein UlaG (beta-lactamase superfamily)
MQIDNINLEWLGHAGFKIKNPKVIYIDPFNIPENSEKADFILLTHSHYDHCSIPDINKIIKENTKVICSADCQSKINKTDLPVKMMIAEPGQEIDLRDFKISTFPAYNTDKPFHPRDESWMGYLVKTNEVIIYHAGDTDIIPEMKNLTGHKQDDKKLIALLPVGGRFTMNFEEAFEAAKIIKPFLAVPMHYGSIVGTENDAKDFANLCKNGNISFEIMGKNSG